MSITEQVPAFASAIAAEAVSHVTEVSYDRRCYGVGHLTPEKQVAGQRVLEMDNVLEEDDQQREPHRSTEVVIDVPAGVY